MCRYSMTSYKPHYACFKCKKTFKRRLMRDIIRGNNDLIQAKCPQCSELMANMGLDFASPKKDNSKEWNHIKDLYSVGITFHSCGCSGPGYIPKNKEMLIEYFEKILVDYDKQLTFWRNRTEPLNKKEVQRENSKNWENLSQIPSDNRPKKGTISNEDAKKYWINKKNEVRQKIDKLKLTNKAKI